MKVKCKSALIKSVTLLRDRTTKKNVRSRKTAAKIRANVKLAIIEPGYRGILTRLRHKTIQNKVGRNHVSKTPNKNTNPKKSGTKRKASSGEGCSSSPAEKRLKFEDLMNQPSCSSTTSPGGSQTHGTLDDASIENVINNLMCTFPDCDPDYIREQLIASPGDGTTRQKHVYQHLDENYIKYPKIKNVLKRQYAESLQEIPYNSEEFIYRYPKLDANFKAGRVSKSYLETAMTCLSNEFLYMPSPYIKDMVKKHQLNVAYQRLKEENTTRVEKPSGLGKRGRYLKNPRITSIPYPSAIDEEFFWELFYVKNETEIKGLKESRELERKVKYSQAAAKSELIECPICLGEVIKEELLTCSDSNEQHSFCMQCLVSSAREGIGQGKAYVPCLFPTCTNHLPLSMLQKTLPYDLFTIAVKRIQQEEIRKANIDGLVSCPHCTYAVIFPEGSTQTMLQCENPQCLAATCSLCKKPGHGTIECGKIDQAKANLQKHLEEAITEAVVRYCPKCNTPFIKDVGCNNMTCATCGTRSCYFCRKETDGSYNHFAINQRCNIEKDTQLIHAKDVKTAYKIANQKFRDNHACLKGIKLDYDLIKEWKWTGI